MTRLVQLLTIARRHGLHAAAAAWLAFVGVQCAGSSLIRTGETIGDAGSAVERGGEVLSQAGALAAVVPAGQPAAAVSVTAGELAQALGAFGRELGDRWVASTERVIQGRHGGDPSLPFGLGDLLNLVAGLVLYDKTRDLRHDRREKQLRNEIRGGRTA